MSVSSGKLACNNIFCLDEHVRDKLLEDDAMKKKKQSEIDGCKQQQQLQKQSLTFENAAIKYFGQQTLLVEEIKALLRYTAKKDDSPIKTKVAELQQQLHRRQQSLESFNFGNSTVDVGDGANKNVFLVENEMENSKNIQNIFLPNSGIVPEFGSIDFNTTRPLSGLHDTSSTPELRRKEQECQQIQNISEFRITKYR
jgi:hypothetical protein